MDWNKQILWNVQGKVSCKVDFWMLFVDKFDLKLMFGSS